MTRDELNRRNGFIDGKAEVKSYPWHMVTGRDFGRAIKWSRERGNTLFEQIKKRIEQGKK